MSINRLAILGELLSVLLPNEAVVSTVLPIEAVVSTVLPNEAVVSTVLPDWDRIFPCHDRQFSMLKYLHHWQVMTSAA